MQALLGPPSVAGAAGRRRLPPGALHQWQTRRQLSSGHGAWVQRARDAGHGRARALVCRQCLRPFPPKAAGRVAYREHVALCDALLAAAAERVRGER